MLLHILLVLGNKQVLLVLAKLEVVPNLSWPRPSGSIAIEVTDYSSQPAVTKLAIFKKTHSTFSSSLSGLC
jgi:hypothetical protein